MNQLLVITGLGDKVGSLESLTQKWPERFSLQPTVHAFGWDGPESSYEEKQNTLLNKVDELAKLGNLAVLGVSAGGHKAESLLAERPELIQCVVNVCGRGQVGNWRGHIERSPVFRHSLEVLEGQRFDASKLMTFRPLFDELVPGWTVPVEGATNIQLRTIGHMPSIVWALTGRAQTIADFVHERTGEE
jgi:hypothetical protein